MSADRGLWWYENNENTDRHSYTAVEAKRMRGVGA